jgi:hypothetical protein
LLAREPESPFTTKSASELLKLSVWKYVGSEDSVTIVRSRRVKTVELPVPVPEFEVRGHWHARSDSSPAQGWLRGQVIGTLSKL